MIRSDNDLDDEDRGATYTYDNDDMADTLWTPKCDQSYVAWTPG